MLDITLQISVRLSINTIDTLKAQPFLQLYTNVYKLYMCLAQCLKTTKYSFDTFSVFQLGHFLGSNTMTLY